MKKGGEFEYRFRGNPEVQGLTPQIAGNLLDIVRKFGQVSPKTETVSFRSGQMEGLNFQLYITGSTEQNNNRLIVGKQAVFAEGTYIIRNRDGSYILWDKTLKAKETQDAIKKIDEEARKAGLIDTRTGKRLALPDRLAIQKPHEVEYSVDSVFPGRGGGLFIPPGEDPMKYLKKFDRPDELEISEIPGGAYGIRRKADKPYLEARERISKQLVKEAGIDINNSDDITKLSPDEISALKRKIEERLKQAGF